MHSAISWKLWPLQFCRTETSEKGKGAQRELGHARNILPYSHKEEPFRENVRKENNIVLSYVCGFFSVLSTLTLIYCTDAQLITLDNVVLMTLRFLSRSISYESAVFVKGPVFPRNNYKTIHTN